MSRKEWEKDSLFPCKNPFEREKLSPFINIREKYGEKKQLKSFSFSKKAG